MFGFKPKNKKVTVSASDNLEKLQEFFGIDVGEISRNKLTAATYYSCMLIRCNAIAKLPIKIKQRSDSGSITARGHPLYELLKFRPNQFVNAHDFIWATEFQRLEYGNAFWVKNTVGGKIESLYLLDSTQVEIVVDDGCILSDKYSVYYVYRDLKKGALIYNSDEIVHFKNFAIDGVKGKSVKRYIGDIIESEQYARKIMKSKYKEGLQDPIVVEYTGDLSPEKQNKIKRKFETLGGASNAGKVIPIPTDFKITQLETKLVNSQFFQLQGLTTRQIANAFGVKSFQLNDMEKSTYNNIEQQNKAFYSDTLQNVITTYEQEIDYKLLFSHERVAGYYSNFNADVMLRSDTESRYKAYQTGISSGFLKISEVRQKEDLPFVEGTDRLIIGNGASIPLDALGNQYAEKGGE